ncbi:Mitochondrial copper homeostasis protein [Ceratocystis pirilliformis]|uniref:Cytochrome c oxidase-assembly factor COX23, mitochondrial n=1 Tax=Ceratocystis pirilliformis TaxID=259994 RepID=A0ABR3Z157_9PEZI
MSSQPSNDKNPTASSEPLVSEEKRQQFRAKDMSKYFDPCQEAADRSIRCLHRNPNDKSLCSDYFQAYRDCKKAWLSQKSSKWF